MKNGVVVVRMIYEEAEISSPLAVSPQRIRLPLFCSPSRPLFLHSVLRRRVEREVAGLRDEVLSLRNQRDAAGIEMRVGADAGAAQNAEVQRLLAEVASLTAALAQAQTSGSPSGGTSEPNALTHPASRTEEYSSLMGGPSISVDDGGGDGWGSMDDAPPAPAAEEKAEKGFDDFAFNDDDEGDTAFGFDTFENEQETQLGVDKSSIPPMETAPAAPEAPVASIAVQEQPAQTSAPPPLPPGRREAHGEYVEAKQQVLQQSLNPEEADGGFGSASAMPDGPRPDHTTSEVPVPHDNEPATGDSSSSGGGDPFAAFTGMDADKGDTRTEEPVKAMPEPTAAAAVAAPAVEAPADAGFEAFDDGFDGGGFDDGGFGGDSGGAAPAKVEAPAEAAAGGGDGGGGDGGGGGFDDAWGDDGGFGDGGGFDDGGFGGDSGGAAPAKAEAPPPASAAADDGAAADAGAFDFSNAFDASAAFDGGDGDAGNDAAASAAFDAFGGADFEDADGFASFT